MWGWISKLSALGGGAALVLMASPAAAVCPPRAPLDGPPGDPDEGLVTATLDALHQFASIPNGESYFALFAADAVFIGTDAGERWSVPEFRAYAEPHFRQGKGWTYKPRERHVAIADDRATAWFDELLDSPSYGRARGSGVLAWEPEPACRWKIKQYVLSFPIPNDLAKEMTARIREHEAKAAPAR